MNQLILLGLLAVIVLLLILVLTSLYKGWFTSSHAYSKNARRLTERKVEPPSGFLVTLETAAKMIWTYREGRGKIIEEAIGHVDSKSVWYPLDIIKQYGSWIEQVAAEKNIPVTGMRFYFAAYPKEDKDDYGEKAGYQTFVIFPTTYHKGQHRTFDPRLSIDREPFLYDQDLVKRKNESIEGYKSNLSDEGGTIVYMADKNGTQSSGANLGHVCPPNGDCS